MATHDNPRNKYQHNREDLLASNDVAGADKELIVEFLDAIDPENMTVNFTNGNGETETKSVGTLHSYAHNLKRVAAISDTPLVELTTDEINDMMNGLANGNHPECTGRQADGYSAGTLKGWQSAVSKFYEYHTDLDVDPSEIVIAKQERTSVDETMMYTREDVQALREACDNPRDRCLLELLLNTGQRIRAIQTLRIKDVEPDEGETGIYRLNTDADGLKGAEKVGVKRPLLGARRAVHEWLKFHPKADDPDAALITKQPGHSRGTAGEPIAQSTIRRTLRKIAENAGIDTDKKPPNPHSFRHFFVTMCKREYDMDDSTIKFLIGHGQGSTIMETTYQHLSDEDHIEEAEVKSGMREPEDESPLTPDVCPVCGDHLAPDAKACGGCGEVFAPDSRAVKAELEHDVNERKEEAEDLDTYKLLDKLERLADEKPELLEKLDEL